MSEEKSWQEEEAERIYERYNRKKTLKEKLKIAKIRLEDRKFAREYEKIRKANEEAGVYDGLIQEYDMMQLIAHSPTTINGVTYTVECYRIYEDHLFFQYNILVEDEDGFLDVKEAEVTVPREEGKRFYELECRGTVLVWDSFDLRHKTKPNVAEEDWKEVNPWIWVVPCEVLRVEKEYAEHNLSADCLEYGIYDNAGYYVWNIRERWQLPVCLELRSILLDLEYDAEGILEITDDLVKIYDEMCFFNSTYRNNKGFAHRYLAVERKKLLRELTNLQKKELWEPGK